MRVGNISTHVTGEVFVISEESDGPVPLGEGVGLVGIDYYLNE